MDNRITKFDKFYFGIVIGITTVAIVACIATRVMMNLGII